MRYQYGAAWPRFTVCDRVQHAALLSHRISIAPETLSAPRRKGKAAL
ncbi:hypothetical protein BVG79_01786 [Ketogulonicigenium robustum]|uniref:Uncharacterized protein n=1 Tax=Ketogulonicigenium robustum TaxID=92947 RepID=A0A1W6P1C9_9RHOB|nr:hypothetical protein BVG79_01786 [Ketogulonicigenium robustum]